MHLYLLTETVNIDVSEITLEGGHAPAISNQRGFRDGFKELDISVEPALWFKVLVIDAISIDCIRRHISWSSISGVALDFKGSDSGIGACGSSTDDMTHLTKTISDSPFDCGEFYAYDQDLDEVFDTVPTFVSDYHLNDLSKEEFHMKLMHLLHVYILPNIRLGCEDIDNVSKSLKQQDNLLQEMDRQILRLSENLLKWQNDLKEQRKKFVEEILKFSSIKHCSYSKDFVGVLVEDVTSDVSKAWLSFEKVQKEVDRYKLLPPGSFDSKLLQIQYSERDELYRKYENFDAAWNKLREIQNSKESFMKKLPKVFESDAHHESARCGVYMCLKKGEEEKISEIRALTDRKLLMLSVKEAMWTTLDELTKGRESFGVGMVPTGSAKATDVLNGLTTSTAWQTLAERVSRVFATAQNSVTRSHFKFCAEVNASCLRLIEDGRVVKRSSSQSTLCIRSSGQWSTTSERSTSLGSLEISTAKREQQPPIHPSGDWTWLRNGRDSRDSAVSENSCHSVDSRHNSAVYAHDSPVENRDSAQSGLSASSENSNSDVNQGQPDAKAKKKKSKIKNKTPKTAKSTFHSWVTDSQQTKSHGPCDGPATTVFSPRDDISNSRRGIELLLEQVRQHFDAICRDLQKELELTPQKYFRKIWLNYESHFYQETIDSIIRLYEFEYSSTAEELCRLVRTLTVTDLSLEDALLSHMLQDVAETDGSSPTEESGKQVEQSPSEIQGEHPFANLLRNKTKNLPPKLLMSQSAKLPSEKTTLEEFSSNASEDLACGVDADPSVCVLRQHLGAHPQRPKTVRLSLSVRHPKFGDIMYERMLCPVRNSVLLEDSVISETACDPSAPTEGDLSSPRCDSNTSGLPEPKINLRNSFLPMKPKYKKQFALAFRCIDIAVATRCPSVKCQHLTKCLREVSNQISSFYQELYGQSVEACSDQLMDALIILLCNVELSLLPQLYCQLMMLADIIPPFFDGSPFCFTLVQFVGACQFIHERVLLKKNQKSS